MPYRANTLENAAEWFWSKVDVTSDCWLWTGADAARYGKVRLNGQSLSVHRASWLLYFGAIPDGMFVCHRCDVQNCVRPDHLFLGTPKDNTKDMLRKGRNRFATTEQARINGRRGGYARAHALTPEERSDGARRAALAVRTQANQNTYKTYCPQGHPFDIQHDGKRYCSICRRGASRRWKAKQRGLARSNEGQG